MSLRDTLKLPRADVSAPSSGSAFAFDASFAKAAPSLAFVIVWTLAFGLPTLRMEGLEDAFFSEVAHLWATGRAPYIHAYDIKPPMFFAMLATAQTLFGATIETIHALSIVCHVVAACAIALIGRRLSAPAAGFAAALTYGVLAPALLANAAYPPLVAVAALAFCAALAPISIEGRAALAGLLAGAAVMTKQTAVFDAAAILALLARDPDADGKRLRTFLVFAFCGSLIPVAFLVYFAIQGGATVFLADIVAFALRRPGATDPGTALDDIRRIASRLELIGPAVILAAVASFRARSLLTGVPASRADGLVLWFILTALGLGIQRAIGLAYIGPLMPPALLLAFVLAQKGFGSANSGLSGLRMAILGFICVCVAYPHSVWKFPLASDGPAAEQAAAAIRAAGPRSDDRLLVLDFGGWVNILADLAPPTPVLHRAHLLCEFPNAGPASLRDAFAAHPRFVIVGTHFGQHDDCDGPSAWPIADAAIASGYRELADVAGRVEDLHVYEIKPAGAN